METYGFLNGILQYDRRCSVALSQGKHANNILTGNFEELSNQYYSYIPHSFGRNRPPIIRTLEMLKPEIELLDSLSDLKNADEILKKAKESASQIHPLDSRFRGLGMEEMQALSPSSSEFSEINQYLHKTCGTTHHVKYEVQDIFRIQREGEFERFDKSEYTAGSDRRLLWHGKFSINLVLTLVVLKWFQLWFQPLVSTRGSNCLLQVAARLI